MTYCEKCGQVLSADAKFCPNCGTPVGNNKEGVFWDDRHEAFHLPNSFEGKVYKCPNCGEVLKSFVRNCPTCGAEIRGSSTTSAVQEFANHIANIEASRVHEGFFSRLMNANSLSSADKQIVDTIKSFTMPNTKEDLLEFMILAEANIDVKGYDSFRGTDYLRERAINDAWMAKAKQVYNKAEKSCGSEKDFKEIKQLYKQCQTTVKRGKKRNIIKSILAIGWMPLVFVLILGYFHFTNPQAIEKENVRLEKLVDKVYIEIENEDYEMALGLAETIEYSPNTYVDEKDENKIQWDVKREKLIREIISMATEKGITLERSGGDNSGASGG